MSLLDAPLDAPPRSARLSRDDVAAVQRERMLRAMVAAVADKGYAATVVADVVSRARVSRKTFYEQFDGLLGCFLAAYDECLEHLRAHLVAAIDDALPVRGQLRRALEAYLTVLAERPELARTYLVEAYAAGPEAVSRRERTLMEFATVLRTMHQRLLAEEELPGRPLDDIGYEILVGGVIAAATWRVATGRTATLPELIDPLYAHLLRALDAVE